MSELDAIITIDLTKFPVFQTRTKELSHFIESNTEQTGTLRLEDFLDVLEQNNYLHFKQEPSEPGFKLQKFPGEQQW